MVSFTPTEDQKLLVETLNRYAVNDVRPVAHEHDEASDPAESVIKTGWQDGLSCLRHTGRTWVASGR